MRFLADACVALRVASWLREAGHEAVHVRELGLQQIPDGEVFALAARQSRVVLTFDLDFGEIVAFSSAGATGVMVFRLRDTTTGHVIARLQAVLPAATEALSAGAIVIVEESRHRVRYWPPE